MTTYLDDLPHLLNPEPCFTAELPCFRVFAGADPVCEWNEWCE